MAGKDTHKNDKQDGDSWTATSQEITREIDTNLSIF